jgi:glutaredoxin|tara:strand:+ start:407 stop:670 length:264 start_codon:yes stop_codon:yes gene_type:complete
MYEIYGTKNCRFCDKAKTILKEQGQEYTFIDVAESDDITAAFFKKFPNVNKVPQIMYDGVDRGYPVHIGGFQQLEAWLGARYTGDRK